MCLSYTTTLKVMDVIAEGFDEEVIGWKESLLPRVILPLLQVS